MAEEIQQRLDTQESDGSWRWHPKDAKTASLGTAGESVLGTCAESALLLLKYARITGNKTSREAGLKAPRIHSAIFCATWRTNVGMPDVSTRCSCGCTCDRCLC